MLKRVFLFAYFTQKAMFLQTKFELFTKFVDQNFKSLLILIFNKVF